MTAACVGPSIVPSLSANPAWGRAAGQRSSPASPVLLAVLGVALSLGLQFPAPPGTWASDPWIVATEQEMATLADAEQWVQIDTGYFTSIENLDDFIAVFPPTNPFDDINDGGGTRVIDPASGRWTPDRKDLRNPPRLWQGPYLSFQQGRISIEGSGYDPGTLLDVWGTPYYLFTPLGLARPVDGAIALDLYGDAFDRYAVVSLGPDGVMSGDDLFRFFGSAPTVLAVSSLTPSRAPAGASLRIRGFNFGSVQGASRVLLNGRDVGAAESWSSRQIVFRAPAWAESGSVRVQVGAAVSDPPLPFTLAVSRAGRPWTKYE